MASRANKWKLLVVDDEATTLRALGRVLGRHALRMCGSYGETMPVLDARFLPGAVVSDYNLGLILTGADLLRVVAAKCPVAGRIPGGVS